MKNPSLNPFVRRPAAALVAFLTWLGAWQSPAALLTFEVRGQMNNTDADFTAGDKFTGRFTFDPAASFVGSSDSTITRQYIAITAWDLTFDRGYQFIRASAPSPFDVIALGNNTTFGDRYIVTLNGGASTGLSLPSGRTLSFWQIDLQDPNSSGADLLSDSLLPGTFPDINTAPYHGGRLLFSNGNQPFFTLIPVPEPGTMTLVMAGAVLLGFQRRFKK